MNKGALIFVSLILLFSVNTYAAQYRIVFKEGEHVFDYILPYEDLGNKYLAKVQLYKDEVMILDNIRGSTLSDSIFYYQMWHDGIKDRSPTDKDIQDIFASWDSQVEGISTDSNISKFLKDMNEIIRFFASFPVVWSGRYKFVIGLHKNGNSVHGHPYVPRLRGTWDKENPYNATSGNITDETLSELDGIWLSTINKNNQHAMKKIAAGINIHDGRRSRDYRDSEGCLTIHPDDWDQFIHKLPNINSWKSEGHTGEVIVIRKHEEPAEESVAETPTPPSSLRIRIMEFFGIGK